jgi:hypothetical protein
LVRADEGAKPRYFLMPAHEVPGCEGHMPALSDPEQRALAELKPGYRTFFPTKISPDWGGASPYVAALGLMRKGLARDLKGGNFEPVAYDAAKAAEPDWIWLPNALVRSAAGETPPVRLVRQAQNPAALRLFVDLYHAHALAADGGVHWRRIRQEYTRHKVGEHGAVVVWGFKASKQAAWGDAPFVAPHMTGKTVDGSKTGRDTGWEPFWEAWSLLIRLGLVELVGHVVEADNDTAEIVHPYAIGNGETDERALAIEAHAAAEAMLTDGQIQWASKRGLHLLPARAHYANVQLVGIARAKYRPKTKATSEWIDRRKDWSNWREFYREIADGSARQSRRSS